ncbi:uncharacterized protein PHACADRAFT_98817 [Phanerochaete carnosa HHB-10118-sp]|uniref:Terpenoid synthase n=1 Tax=Phanerochaete carnosa (strain HHB-10118-sp) TaxID=650164 RepID=K5VPZ9_PHACS|nr:uncharacterized protein PHACADRAFT_98817 [Phanerochaete carnosa HHB-10118-sp]EKM53553.1 hypothetical protein PHACADRAFT_98817 [Phanerochaete carnosa HHB-10118-sp]
MSPNGLLLPDTALDANSLVCKWSTLSYHYLTCYFHKPDLCRKTITEFLHRTGIPLPGFDSSAFGDEIDRLAHAEVQTWNLGGVSPNRFEHCLTTGIDIAKMAYRHTPVETQVHIALWTALCVCIDDLDAGVEVPERFHVGREQLHPLLDLLADNIRRMHEFFHPYGATIIATCTVQFVACALVDRETKAMNLHPSARGYPLYKRARNGLGEGYSYCIWDKTHFPDVSSYIQSMPDLCSFYKEELVDEKNNFIHDRACVTSKDIEATLMATLGDAVDAVNRGREILQGEERQAWESHVVGYVAFHFMTPRYRLEELFSTSG